MSDDVKIQNDISEDKIAKLEAERNEYLSGWQRAKADFANYKRDESERMNALLSYRMEDVLTELIQVIDNFDLGLRALEKQGEVEKGIYMIRAQLADLLRRRGLEEIKISPGSMFDPRECEAIATVESEMESGMVVEEIEPGYRYNGKVIRPARVKVAK